MRINRLLIVSVAFALSLVFVFTETQVAQSPEKPLQQEMSNQLPDSEKQLLEADFQEDQTPDQVLQLLASRQLAVEYLVHRSGEHTAWYVLDDHEPVREAIKNFEQQHARFLQDQLIDNAAQILPEDLIDGSASRQSVQKSRIRLAQDFADQLSDLRNIGFVISGFAVRGNRSNLSDFVEDLPVDKTKLRPLTEPKSTPQRNHAKSRMALAMVASGNPYPGQPWKFSPTSGVISYDANSKYFTSSFVWSDVSGFNSTHSAYEHDITLSAPKDTYVKPGSGAWFTNLPDAYLDTPLFDDATLFTIGSASATQIKADTGYYVQMPVKVVNENAGPARGVIQPQLGSWAGRYFVGESRKEILEPSVCQTLGGATLFFRGLPAFCVNADQTHTIRPYKTGSSMADFFPFNHKISSSASWKAQAAAPTINPGSLSSSQASVKATISTTTVGATIRYTTNGSDPTSSSAIYSGPLTFTSSVTLKARAFKSGLSNSDVTTVNYSIVRGNPVIDKVRFLSTPIGGKRFLVTIEGRQLDPSVIRIVVTGPGCSNFGSCVVPNKVLKEFGILSTTRLPNVPLTLSAGRYQLFVQNAASGTSRASAGYVIDVNVPPLELTRIKPQTTPRSGKQFLSKFEGNSFDKARIRVVVTGPGCPNFGMCVVPNKVIKDFGSISATQLSKVPMKLAAGKYKIYVQNGTSFRDPVSNPYSLTVR